MSQGQLRLLLDSGLNINPICVIINRSQNKVMCNFWHWWIKFMKWNQCDVLLDFIGSCRPLAYGLFVPSQYQFWFFCQNYPFFTCPTGLSGSITLRCATTTMNWSHNEVMCCFWLQCVKSGKQKGIIFRKVHKWWKKKADNSWIKKHEKTPGWSWLMRGNEQGMHPFQMQC